MRLRRRARSCRKYEAVLTEPPPGDGSADRSRSRPEWIQSRRGNPPAYDYDESADLVIDENLSGRRAGFV